jgi:transposase
MPSIQRECGVETLVALREGAPWLKTTLVQAAWAAARTNGSYERALFLRLKSRRGPKKAIVAVAASMLGAAYHILRNRTPYRSLGPVTSTSTTAPPSSDRWCADWKPSATAWTSARHPDSRPTLHFAC